MFSRTTALCTTYWSTGAAIFCMTKHQISQNLHFAVQSAASWLTERSPASVPQQKHSQPRVRDASFCARKPATLHGLTLSAATKSEQIAAPATKSKGLRCTTAPISCTDFRPPKHEDSLAPAKSERRMCTAPQQERSERKEPAQDHHVVRACAVKMHIEDLWKIITFAIDQSQSLTSIVRTPSVSTLLGENTRNEKRGKLGKGIPTKIHLTGLTCVASLSRQGSIACPSHTLSLFYTRSHHDP